MLFDPTERNVNPFQTKICTMQELVLALAFHDKNVTMANPARVAFLIRTGQTSPFEDCGAAKAHRNNELGFTTPPKQRFVIALPTNTRAPSPVKVQVRSSRIRATARRKTLRYDPFLTQSPAAETDENTPTQNNHTPPPSPLPPPDLAVFPLRVPPTQLLTSLPGPGDEVAKSGVGRRDTDTTHPGLNSGSWEIFRLRHPTRPAHASSCTLPNACCKRSGLSHSRMPEYSYSKALFSQVHKRLVPLQLCLCHA